MKLFDAPWAPSPRRVRIFVAEKGIEIERVVLDLRTGAHLQPPYSEMNPRGQVPALLLDDGTLIDDSVAICRYLEAIHPQPPLFGRNPCEAGIIEAWNRRIDSDCYTAVMSAFRNSVPSFADRALSGQWPPIAQIPALAERGRLMWGAFIAIFDARLASVEYVAGDAFSFADIVALVAVDFGIATRLPDPRDHPSIARWHALVSTRPSASA
ncbi:MAG: glutathione S-transferase family protein [Rhizorhabdus sp.]|nr:glutathione S-transferase family protein [Rhizorhabdus sp.]